MDEHRCLPQEILKLIACVTMLIDHIGAAFFPNALWIRMIGRLAFPIYCFLLSEGMRRTRDPGKYLLRLFLGIFLAELPFDYLFFGGMTWSHQNVMVTLTLGGFMLLCIRKMPDTLSKVLLVIPFAVLAEFCQCDYGAYGILLIALFGLSPQWHLQLLGMLALGLWKDGAYIANALPYFDGFSTFDAALQILRIQPPIQGLALLALIPIGLYNRQKLTRSKALQTGFYLFYPVHLAVLVLIANFLL